MHAPYVKKIFGDHDIKLIPIVIGSVSYKKEQEFGKILSDYFKDDETLFIISSDFCHWGDSFDYMPIGEDKKEPVSTFIERMDKEGMDAIEQQDSKRFNDYLK